MKRRTAATTGLEDGFTLKELFGGELPKIPMPEPEAPPPCLELARRALERSGYVVVECMEVRGRRGNVICEFILSAQDAPVIADDDPLMQHIEHVFAQEGLHIPPGNLVVSAANDGNQMLVGFLAWLPEP